MYVSSIACVNVTYGTKWFSWFHDNKVFIIIIIIIIIIILLHKVNTLTIWEVHDHAYANPPKLLMKLLFTCVPKEIILVR